MRNAIYCVGLGGDFCAGALLLAFYSRRSSYENPNILLNPHHFKRPAVATTSMPLENKQESASFKISTDQHTVK